MTKWPVQKTHTHRIAQKHTEHLDSTGNQNKIWYYPRTPMFLWHIHLCTIYFKFHNTKTHYQAWWFHFCFVAILTPAYLTLYQRIFIEQCTFINDPHFLVEKLVMQRLQNMRCFIVCLVCKNFMRIVLSSNKCLYTF